AVNGRDIAVNGNLALGGNLALNASGAISQTGGAVTATSAALSAGTTISQTGGTISATDVALDAGSIISQSNGATISATNLSGQSSGGTTLDDANHIANLSGFTNSNGGGFSLTDTEGLTVTAAVDAGSDNLALHVTGDLGVGANLTAGKAATLDVSGAIGQTAGTISATDVALNAGGTISQSGGATIGATGTLSGTSTGGTTLDDTNRVANLGSFTNTGTGGFSLTDAEGLTITAAVAAGSDNLALHVTGDL